MNIGFDAKRLFCNRTGLGNYARNLVRDLQVQFPQHQYQLYTPKIASLVDNLPFQDPSKFTIYLPSKRSIPALWRSAKIVKDLKINKVGLYHGLSNEIPLGLSRSGIASLVTIHDLIFKTQPQTFPWSERVIYDTKFSYACKHANKIIAISEQTKQDIMAYYGIEERRIDVVYQSCHEVFRNDSAAISKEVLQEQLPQLPQNYFLYVGTIEARKNLKLIIEAYNLDDAQHLLPIVVVGRGGAYKKLCQETIAKYKLQDRFIFLEQVGGVALLQSVYKYASGLVYPSKYEGFGIPIIEAIYSSIPVVTTRNASLPEAAGPHSYYIDDADPEQLLDTLLGLMDVTDEVSLRIKKSYQYAEQNFNPSTIAKEVMRIYQSI
jgi:glycosyltransferase involved in cell wall biosynthesis